MIVFAYVPQKASNSLVHQNSSNAATHISYEIKEREKNNNKHTDN